MELVTPNFLFSLAARNSSVLTLCTPFGWKPGRYAVLLPIPSSDIEVGSEGPALLCIASREGDMTRGVLVGEELADKEVVGVLEALVDRRRCAVEIRCGICGVDILLDADRECEGASRLVEGEYE